MSVSCRKDECAFWGLSVFVSDRYLSCRRVAVYSSVCRTGRYCKSCSTSDSDTSEAADGEDSDDICPVCLQKLQSPKKLKCGHVFCLECIEQAMKFKPRCPKCQYNYGIQTGSQPQSGRMTYRISPLQHIPGFPHVGSIIIDYDFPSGVQEVNLIFVRESWWEREID